MLISHHADGVREALGVGVALAAAVADWRGVRIAPQIRRQVPKSCALAQQTQASTTACC
jgi:hypothetical protein